MILVTFTFTITKTYKTSCRPIILFVPVTVVVNFFFYSH